MVNHSFIPGLELSRLFFKEIVEPLLVEAYQRLRYAAALIGPGSEVLGFDDEMSTDHHWGPRLLLFLNESEMSPYAASIHEFLADHLPYRFRGYSTNFSPPDPNDNGTRLLREISSGPVNHRVEMWSLRALCQDQLGLELDGDLTAIDWLTIPVKSCGR